MFQTDHCRGSNLKRVIVKVPSTTANLGPGFDVFGLALKLFHDIVEVSLTQRGISIEAVGGYSDSVPKRPEENTAGVVAEFFLKKLNLHRGVHIQLIKGIRPSIGLGSSAASAAATAIALDRLFETHLSKEELLEIAAQGELASAGVPHADNAAAALFGGFTVVRQEKPIDVIRFSPPSNLEVSVAIPQLPAPTKKTQAARSILPKNLPLEQMIKNLSNASFMMAGFCLSDVDLIGRYMVDKVIEPARANMILGYDAVRKSALESGASGVAISGAGPSIIAIINTNRTDASSVAEAMKKAFESSGVKAEAYVAKPDEGAEIIGES